MEENKRRAAEEREQERVNAAAAERIRSKSHPTFADFLAEEDPIGVLWPFVVSRVFHESRSRDVEVLTPAAKQLYFVVIMDGEVMNGGFHQFFSNTSGDYAHEALAALRELGAAETSTLLQTAIDTFPKKQVPKDRAQRNALLDRIDPKTLDAIDGQYYALAKCGSEDLAELILRFMRTHARERPFTS